MIESLSALVVPGIIGILTGGFYLLRRWSRDKLEIAKDRAETDVLKHLIRQRDEAVAEKDVLKAQLVSIAEENEEAVEKIRALTGENEQMRARIQMLNLLVKRLAAINNMPQNTHDTSTPVP